ncbi:hypothetical protein NA57DRAFT_22277, partial [Rhizodiscina lignyota]
CSPNPLANDILLVMKTGATEVSAKVPIHLTTTFTCTPDYLVFSDVAETFEGIEILDALEHLPEYIDKERQPDEWRFYSKLQDISHSLPDNHNRSAFENLGKEGVDEAWKLDKFKNMPMLHKSYELHPNKSWYVFVDADSSILFSTLLTWLAKFDHNKPYYMGSQNLIGDMEFGHGGSGYVLSSAAVRILAKEDAESKLKHNKWAMETCCGDLTVANALLDHDVHLTRSWPMIQGETPASLDYGDNHWCHPAVTFHHMSTEEIEAVWHYEQNHLLAGTRTPTFGDVFEAFVAHNITDERDGWDNLCTDEIIERHDDMSERDRLAIESFEGCREACLEMRDCFQFNFDRRAKMCGLSRTMRLGKKKGGKRSGWNLARIERYREEHKKCKMEWIKP